MNTFLITILISLTQILNASKLVVELTPDTFKSIVARKDGGTLVMFYTPWCPHCQTTKPIFMKAAEKMSDLNKNHRFGLINCDDEKNSNLCTSQNIEGYPTIKLFTAKNETHIFNAESTEENFVKFFSDPTHMSDSVSNEQETPDVAFKHTPYLNTDNFKSTLKKVPHALVFFYAPWCPHCQEAKPLLDNATEKLSSKDRAIYAVNCDAKPNKKLCDDEKVEGFPTIRYYHFGEMFAEYDDRMETNSFLEYLSRPPKEKVPIVVPETESTEDEQADETKMQHVKYVNNDDFKELFKEHGGHIMMMFYIPMCSHCKDAKPIFDKVAEQLKQSKGKAILAAVNCALKENEKLCEKEKIGGFPTFIHYQKGKRVKEYTDTPITKEKLILYLSSKVKDEL